MPIFSKDELEDFKCLIYGQGKRLYRDLPWRNISDAYAVLVSEVMLQQTRVSRVEKFWPRFMAVFPTLDALAAASTSDVLELWQGLGYNRRALALKRTADICALEKGGKLPCSEEELLCLPGIGATTAAGLRAFAFNKPAIYIETNVRAVFLHYFFSEDEGVRDKEIIPLVQASCSKNDPRTWYYALLDCGAQLKREAPNPTRRSAHYAKQSSFIGSRRQKRAELLRIVLSAGEISIDEAARVLNEHECTHGREALDASLFASILDDLVREGFFQKEGRLLKA